MLCVTRASSVDPISSAPAACTRYLSSLHWVCRNGAGVLSSLLYRSWDVALLSVIVSPTPTRYAGKLGIARADLLVLFVLS